MNFRDLEVADYYAQFLDGSAPYPSRFEVSLYSALEDQFKYYQSLEAQEETAKGEDFKSLVFKETLCKERIHTYLHTLRMHNEAQFWA